MFQYRKSRPRELQLGETVLKGPATLRLGWHNEAWDFDLTRDGNRFSGTYSRKAPAHSKAFRVTGEVDGDEITRDDNTRRILLLLKGSATNSDGFKTGTASQDMMILLICRDDEILYGWAQAGRINTANHELDFSRLKLAGDRITGKMVVIMHDDRHHDLNPPEEDYRQSGDGGLLAVETALDLTRDGVRWTGTHEAHIGVAWERTGKISGKMAADIGQEGIGE